MERVPKLRKSLVFHRAYSFLWNVWTGGEVGMKCWECEHFEIQYEPIGKISTGIWDFGRAKCKKHDLVVDFPDHRKLKKLECIEQKHECR